MVSHLVGLWLVFWFLCFLPIFWALIEEEGALIQTGLSLTGLVLLGFFGIFLLSRFLVRWWVFWTQWIFRRRVVLRAVGQQFVLVVGFSFFQAELGRVFQVERRPTYLLAIFSVQCRVAFWVAMLQAVEVVVAGIVVLVALVVAVVVGQLAFGMFQWVQHQVVFCVPPPTVWLGHRSTFQEAAVVRVHAALAVVVVVVVVVHLFFVVFQCVQYRAVSSVVLFPIL